MSKLGWHPEAGPLKNMKHLADVECETSLLVLKFTVQNFKATGQISQPLTQHTLLIYSDLQQGTQLHAGLNAVLALMALPCCRRMTQMRIHVAPHLYAP